MRKLVVLGAATLLTLAIAAPLATAGTSTPRTVTGSFIGTYTGPNADGSAAVFRFEVRTDASGAVQFGYYETQSLKDPALRSLAVVDGVRFFRDASGARAAQLSLTECPIGVPDVVAWDDCNAAAVVVVTDGTPDTFCGGTPSEPCLYPFRVDDGNIVISGTGQNGQ